MNIQHSSRTDEWYTPASIMDLVHEVISPIDLDPASCMEANKTVKALTYYDKEDDGLIMGWGDNLSIYLNPPGGKLKGKSLSMLFWEKLMRTNIKHAIYMGFSLEHLQSSQGKGFKSVGEFPICIPKKRIKFVGAGNSPSHSNVIAYIPGSADKTCKFKEVFKDLGLVIGGLDAD